MEQIFDAIVQAITLQALGMVAIGVFAGITVGAIPGLTSVMAIAVLVPFSFFMTPINGIPFLLKLYIPKEAITGLFVEIIFLQSLFFLVLAGPPRPYNNAQISYGGGLVPSCPAAPLLRRIAFVCCPIHGARGSF